MMTPADRSLNVLVVAAAGGLGAEVVRQTLARGHRVSALVRQRAKLEAALGSLVPSLAAVHVGDATEAPLVQAALKGVDVVFVCRGADPQLAGVVARAAKDAGVGKLVFVAGATNVLADDGLTLNYLSYLRSWPQAEGAYKAHQACIDAIRATGLVHVVLCPGFMKAVGNRSVPDPVVRINRPSGNFLSYEDGAWIMVQAAETAQWDGQLITAATAP